MKTENRKSADGLKAGMSNSDFDAVIDYVEKSQNCEFVRIMEHFSKMDDDGRRKLMSFAQKMAE
ncbi:MAG: hypothetical protein WC637_15625 [Victivallales bacterium]|jgi:hypothetical protein